MELIKKKLSELKSALAGVRELQITAKGNAEISLHTKSKPSSPKFKVEMTEDGVTVDLTDIMLVGTALCTAVGLCVFIKNLLD